MPKAKGDAIKSMAEADLDVIERLPTDQMSDYTPFLIGNDDPLTTAQLSPYKIDTDFVLVGTSLFRSVDIACKLAKNDTIFPKVIVVDNSRKVSEAWVKIKAFFATSEITSGTDFVVNDEKGLLNFILDDLLMKTVRAENNLYLFFTQFFSEHKLSYVKAVVSNVTVIEQNWGHIDTFNKLKDIYSDKPIVTYSSNIIDYVDNPVTKMSVLQCLSALNPRLSLVTNLDTVVRRPTKSYVLLDSRPEVIADALGLSDEVRAACRLTRDPSIISIEPNLDVSTSLDKTREFKKKLSTHISLTQPIPEDSLDGEDKAHLPTNLKNK